MKSALSSDSTPIHEISPVPEMHTIPEMTTIPQKPTTTFSGADKKATRHRVPSCVYSTLSAGFEFMSRHKRYLTAFSAAVYLLMIGGYLAVGNFAPYLASYLTAAHFNFKLSGCTPLVQDEYATNTAICNWLIAAFTLGYAGFGCVGGILQLYWGTRSTVLFGGSLIILQFLISYYYTSNVYIMLACSFGVSYGIGSGISWSPAIVCVIRWFPNNKALMCGVMMSATACGSIIFSMMQTNIINPNNVPNDENCGYTLQPSIVDQVPVAFFFMAIFSVVCALLGTVFLFDKPIDANDAAADFDPHSSSSRNRASHSHHSHDDEFTPIKQTHTVYVDVDKSVEEAGITPTQSADFTLSEAIHSSAFWIIFVNMLMMVNVLCFTYSDWKLFAEIYVQVEDDKFLLQLNITAALCNLVGRIIWGSIYDYWGCYKKTMLATTSLTLLSIISLPACNDKTMIFMWVCMLWFVVSATYVVMPPAIANTFGDTYCAILTGCMMFAEILSTGLQSGIFTMIQFIHIDQDQRWLVICFINSFFVIVSMAVSFKFKPPVKTAKIPENPKK